MGLFLDAVQTMLGGRSVGKALLVAGLVLCLYQVYRRWYVGRLVASKFRGKVVLITGASSGLGEGKQAPSLCVKHVSGNFLPQHTHMHAHTIYTSFDEGVPCRGVKGHHGFKKCPAAGAAQVSVG